MFIKYLEYEEIDKTLYTELFNESYVTTPFHSLQWIRLMSFIRKDLKLKFVVFFEGNMPIAIMPYFTKKYLPFTMASSVVGAYGGFLYKKEHRDDVKKVLSTNNISKALTVMNIFNDDIYSELEYLHAKKQSTWILDCSKSYDEVFKVFDAKTRNQIRKSSKSDLIFKYITTESEVNDCKLLYKMLVTKHSIKKPYSLKIFDEIYNKRDHEENIAFCGASKDGKIISFSVFLKSKDQVFYWLNASDKQYSTTNATNGILDWIIEKACSTQGVNIFNFGAVPHGNSGLLHFKKNWGATEVIYDSYVSFLYSKL